MSVDYIREWLTGICLVGAAALTLLLAAAVCGRWLLRGAAAVRPYLLAFLVFAAVAMNFAQKSGTNAPLRGASVELKVESVELDDGQSYNSTLYTLNSQFPQFRLDSETTNGLHSYAMPTNGTRYEKWWRRGAYEDVFRLDLGGFRFPLGTYMCDHLWAYTWGMAGARLRDASNRVVVTGSPMSAVPRLSQFWNAPTTNGTYLLTWQDFALNRDTNTLLSAQLELCPSGDYIARSNDVERVYRRVNPDDWDDDGYPNDADPNPYVFDDGGFVPHQTLPEGANPDAYCWVDIVVSNANALVTFTGDGPSALPDPHFIAKAGETNRVTILIGKTYTVTCPMPIAVVDKSNPEIEVTRTSANRIGIVWPVEIWSEDYGSYFEMFVSPDFLGGSFSWSTNGCCEISGSGSFYSFLCGGGCGCDGCSIDGHYVYDGYSLTMFSGVCGCESHGEDESEPSGVGVGFSRKVLFYEDEYYDEALGVTVPAWSGETVALKCSVSGGQHGGVFCLSLVNIDKLSWLGGDALPVGDVNVPANTELSWRAIYGFAEHSDSEGDVRATATFTENLSGEEMTDTDSMTVVMLTVVADEMWPTNMERRVFGVGEEASIYKTPNIPTEAVADRGVCAGGNYRIGYSCPYDGGDDSVVVTAKSSSHSLVLGVLEPCGYSAINIDSNFFATVGQSGGFKMLFTCRLLPECVSFYKKVEIVEVACTSTDPVGYYAQPSKSHLLDHGQHGAGNWNAVGQENSISDEATMEINYPPWLGGGSFTWPIPNRWRKSGSAVDGKYFCNTDQRFELDADGTSRMRKFGRIGERMTNGVYRIWRQN